MSDKKKKLIRWLKVAAAEFADIIAHIAMDAPQAARRFADVILGKIEALRDFPYLGAECPHFAKARELIHGNYVIYYTIHRQEIVVRAPSFMRRGFFGHIG